MPSQHVYIDTDILRFNSDRNNDLGRVARASIAQVEKSLINPQIKVKIPQVVLGELMIAACQGDCDIEDIKKLLLRLNVEVWRDMPTVNSDVLFHAKDILDKNPLLGPNDALLAAHALTDVSTAWLLTTDEPLIVNRVIKEKMDSMGHRFHISSTFH